MGIGLQRLRDSFFILSVNNNKQFCRQFRIPRKKSSNLEKEIRIGISILVIFKSHEDIFQQLTKLSRWHPRIIGQSRAENWGKIGKDGAGETNQRKNQPQKDLGKNRNCRGEKKGVNDEWNDQITDGFACWTFGENL